MSRYCASSGWSRPSCARTVATFSGVARNPSIVCTGSPGHQVDHQEHEDAHRDDHGDRQEQPANDVARARAHGSVPSRSLDRSDTRSRSTVSVSRKWRSAIRAAAVGAPRRSRPRRAPCGPSRRGPDLAAVRLGAEAQADLPTDLAAQAREVRVPGGVGDRDVDRLVGGARRLAVVARVDVAVQRGADRVRVLGREPRRGGPGDQRLDQLPEVEQALEVRATPAAASAGSSRSRPVPSPRARRRRRCGRGGPRRTRARRAAGSPRGSSCG